MNTTFSKAHNYLHLTEAINQAATAWRKKNNGILTQSKLELEIEANGKSYLVQVAIHGNNCSVKQVNEIEFINTAGSGEDPVAEGIANGSIVKNGSFYTYKEVKYRGLNAIAAALAQEGASNE